MDMCNVEGYHPQLVIIISGKRKSGKDFISEQLRALLGHKSEIFRLSAPLKSHYAKIHNLDSIKLMDTSQYKENHRKAMIGWSEKIRKKDPGYFCRLATENGHLYSIWIISDARRISDMEYFMTKYQCVCVRIEANMETRAKRGFVFIHGVDDAESECGLDHEKFDYTIINDDVMLYSNQNEYRELVEYCSKSLEIVKIE